MQFYEKQLNIWEGITEGRAWCKCRQGVRTSEAGETGPEAGTEAIKKKKKGHSNNCCQEHCLRKLTVGLRWPWFTPGDVCQFAVGRAVLCLKRWGLKVVARSSFSSATA